MTGYVTDYLNNTYKLPQALSWELCHGPGEPCDSFELCIPWDGSMLSVFSDAVGFSAEHGGKTVFRGVVDEFLAEADARAVCTLRGRGMAALLMDNEAEAAEYYRPKLSYILQKHVMPWGVTDIGAYSDTSTTQFRISSGDSQWKVLREFCRFCGGFEPRFSPSGTLLLGSEGDVLRIKADSAMLAQEYGEKRYGVISSVLVKNRLSGLATVVENKEFAARGGRCRRVVNVERSQWYDAMRHTGQYQIEQSMRGRVTCRLTVPELFCAFPGDVIELEGCALGASGEFLVSETRCFSSASGEGTEITLTRR